MTDRHNGLLVGIDLGTTNSALAAAGARGAIAVYDVPQLVATGETGRAATLPSFLYFPTDAEVAAGVPASSSRASSGSIAGIFARDHGALVPSRQVASAKSWLANAAVDRTAALLPWGAEGGPKISPVDASTRLLEHLRDAWNADHPDAHLETLPIVLTVPASFDEEARELTVQAARAAGFATLTLLEEPLAALYAWIAGHRREAAARIAAGALVLVCDVGGGTTDFSLIKGVDADGGVRFERVAIGEHLLLGGDNLDLALATIVEQKLADAGAPRLSVTQRQILRRKCAAAKEQLLSDGDPGSERITIPGAGRALIAGAASADLTREEAVAALCDGFLPLTRPDEHPARDRRIGLRELGLPYEADAGITRHLASFLSRSARAGGSAGLARPDAVLFNGGFFTPAIARERILDALASWFGARPDVLANERPEAAVAVGAAFYARLRRQPDAARRLLIRAGSARAYYVGVRTAAAAPSAVCVLPRGTEEGTETLLDREFSVTTNQPAAFTLYSTTERRDPIGTFVDIPEPSLFHRHAPLVAVMRYGKRSRSVPLDVRLRTVFTETGTLELWCESTTSEHRWRLSFNLRVAEADPFDTGAPEESEAGGQGRDQVVVPDAATADAVALIDRTFSGGGIAPEQLVGDLETTIGFGKQDWPLPTLRRLADALLASMDGRRISAPHESRWCNLTGFCVRPGFGTSLDAWRISELRKVYAAGLTHPKDIQAQVEWIVLWHRVGAGFSAGQQRELAQRVAAQLGIGQRKTGRVNSQIEREGWRLLASLERLDAGQRGKLGDELLARLKRDPRNAGLLWAIGRFGARVPFYGPLNTVVPPAVAERWMDALLGRSLSAAAAAAVAQIGERTDDRARDIGDTARAHALDLLSRAGVPADTLAALAEVVAPDRRQAAQTFGETLPEGLQVASPDGHIR